MTDTEKTRTQDPMVQPPNSTFAYISAGFGLAACLCMGIAVATDNILLFFPLTLLGVAGVVTGVLQFVKSGTARGVAAFGIVVSSIWAILGAACSYVVIRWDSNIVPPDL